MQPHQLIVWLAYGRLYLSLSNRKQSLYKEFVGFLYLERFLSSPSFQHGGCQTMTRTRTIQVCKTLPGQTDSRCRLPQRLNRLNKIPGVVALRPETRHWHPSVSEQIHRFLDINNILSMCLWGVKRVNNLFFFLNAHSTTRTKNKTKSFIHHVMPSNNLLRVTASSRVVRSELGDEDYYILGKRLATPVAPTSRGQQATTPRYFLYTLLATLHPTFLPLRIIKCLCFYPNKKKYSRKC